MYHHFNEPSEKSGFTVSQTQNSSQKTTESPQTASITVHIAGYIANPGVYTVDEGTRVMDLLAIAGGPLPGADLDKVKLAAKLKDGQKIELKPLDSVKSPSKSVKNIKQNTNPSNPINLNQASTEELLNLPGVGKQSAAKLVALRQELGQISSYNDLKKIKGLTAKKIAEIKKHSTL